MMTYSKTLRPSRIQNGKVAAAFWCISTLLLVAGCSSPESSSLRVPESGTSDLLHRHGAFPHYFGHFEASRISSLPLSVSPSAGLEWHQASLFKNTGAQGQANLDQVNGEDGEIIRSVDLGGDYTSGGLTWYDNRLYQLNGDGGGIQIYEADTLELVEVRKTSSRGQGICNYRDKSFIVSDGSSQLTIHSLDTLAIEETLDVQLNGEDLSGLSELECIDDQIWATIDDPNDQGRSTTIVAINRDTGKVEATVDVSSVVPDLENVENTGISGIALRPEDSSLWVLGSSWGEAYSIQLDPVE